MWRRLVDWYNAFEHEQLEVLKHPELAAQVPKGFRRWNATKLAALTPLERATMHDFCIGYRGARLWKALAGFATAFSIIGALLQLSLGRPGYVFWIGFANIVGFSLLMGAIGTWFGPTEVLKSKRKFIVGGLGGAVLGAFASYTAILLAHGKSLDAVLPRMASLASGAIVAGLAVYVPVLLVSAFRRRQYAVQAAQLQQDAERERLARELSESKLRMLRAQIEPHFLFNTLGAVQQLAADGAPRAAALTADLIAFLRASFSDMRCEQVSLKSEFATIESYLRVMQARMGARLRFAISLPDALAAREVPSMIVLTLVENAIKHGIEPSLRGGEIHVSAEAQDASIRICVRDSGVGMSDTPGHGAGLDNVRRRLQLAYGDAAELVLREADPGLNAELHLPAAVEEPA